MAMTAATQRRQEMEMAAIQVCCRASPFQHLHSTCSLPQEEKMQMQEDQVSGAASLAKDLEQAKGGCLVGAAQRPLNFPLLSFSSADLAESERSRGQAQLALEQAQGQKPASLPVQITLTSPSSPQQGPGACGP